MKYGQAVDLALLLTHVFLGGMIFAHGFNKVFRGGKLSGTAKWFHSIGMRPGPLNAYLAAGTEIAVGVFLVLGLLTPLACAGLISVMIVAIVSVHRFNGFFVFRPGQGVEYCASVIVTALLLGALGSGQYGLDYLVRHDQPFQWLTRPSHGLAVTAAVGVAAAVIQLLATYRPPGKS